jgi:hypothetical protein
MAPLQRRHLPSKRGRGGGGRCHLDFLRRIIRAQIRRTRPFRGDYDDDSEGYYEGNRCPAASRATAGRSASGATFFPGAGAGIDDHHDGSHHRHDDDPVADGDVNGYGDCRVADSNLFLHSNRSGPTVDDNRVRAMICRLLTALSPCWVHASAR